MNIIPEQKIGKQYDHVTSVVCKSSGEAERKYAMACNRLTAINNWGKIGSSVLHTDFFLCDKKYLKPMVYAKSSNKR